MGLHRDTASLDPKVRALAEAALAAMNGLGIKFWVNETYREQAVQDAYYAQGRKTPEQVNELRRLAGIGPTNETGIITHAKVSNHSKGRAIDIYPTGKKGVPIWNARPEEFAKIASVMKTFGFSWGGDWEGFKDYPHFEIKETM